MDKSGVVFVQPTEWAGGRGKGARFKSGEAAMIMAWANKAQAVAGAKKIGWRAVDVGKIHTRLGGVAYAIVGRFGFMTRASYECLLAASVSGAEGVDGSG